MTTAPATARRDLTHPGQVITHRLDRYDVTLQWLESGVYRVAVAHGGKFGLGGVEIDWASYADEPTARDEARRIAVALHEHASWDAMTEAHLDALDRAEDNRRRRDSAAGTRALRWERVADATRTLTQAMAETRLAADIADHLREMWA